MKLVKVITAIPGLGGEDSSLVMPEDYLGASGESLFIIIVISWIIAYFFSYDNLLNNPLKDIYGYNNVCVAWDVAPALYAAAFMFTAPVYFGIRYAVLDLERAALRNLSSAKMCAVRLASLCYVFSIAGVWMIFMVTPDPSSLVHTKIHAILFLQLVFFRYVIVAVNWVEAEASDVTFKSKVFLVVYGVISALLLIGAGVSMALWKQGGSQLIPPPVMQTVDILWFLCLPLTTKFLPEAQAIRFHLTLEKKDGSVPVGQRQEDLNA